jgi:hypothetical protein
MIPVLLALIAALAQAPSSTIGTASVVRAEAGEIEFKPDHGAGMTVQVAPETVLLRVPSGAKNLTSAQPILLSDINAGDRLLVTLEPPSAAARRVVVMSARAITERNEADRRDWIRRGVAGVVAEKRGDQILLRNSKVVVSVKEGGLVKRYAPDSVKFVDARSSSVAEISAGDQLRARGIKSEDGLSLIAEEVVFGTFLTTAGTVAVVDAAANEITLRELGTNSPLKIRLTADSQLKKMPGFSAMAGGMPGPPTGMRSGDPGMMGPPAGGRPDISQMLERMPAARLDELKPGETVVVSSTKGATKGEVTAIMLLANADMLIRMATAGENRPQAAGTRPEAFGADAGMMGMQGLELPGIVP